MFADKKGRGAIRLMAVAVGALSLAAVASGGAFAADRGSRAEAEAMAKKVAGEVASKGLDAVKAAINSKSYNDRDLYPVIFTPDCVIQAHGVNDKLVGKDMSQAKDPDGVNFCPEFWKAAKADPKGGWVNFKFTDPETKKILPKEMRVENAGGGGYIVVVGAYKE